MEQLTPCAMTKKMFQHQIWHAFDNINVNLYYDKNLLDIGVNKS